MKNKIKTYNKNVPKPKQSTTTTKHQIKQMKSTKKCQITLFKILFCVLLTVSERFHSVKINKSSRLY